MQVQTVEQRPKRRTERLAKLIRIYESGQVSEHPGLPNFPHHQHDGDEENVLPGEPMSLVKVLDHIATHLKT